MDLHAQELSSFGKVEGPCSPSVKPEGLTFVVTQDHPSRTRTPPRLRRLEDRTGVARGSEKLEAGGPGS